MDAVTIKPEPLHGVVGELDVLLHEYWKATDAYKDSPPLAMDWPMFQSMEQANKFMVMVARQGERVLGFVQYFIVPHAHHRQTRTAYCDILAVRLGERGRGLGRALVGAGEAELRRRNVEVLLHSFRLVYGVEPLFPKLGYKPIETLYMKVL